MTGHSWDGSIGYTLKAFITSVMRKSERKAWTRLWDKQTWEEADCDNIWSFAAMGVLTGGRPSRWWWPRCRRKQTVPPRSCSLTPGHFSDPVCPTTPHGAPTFRRSANTTDTKHLHRPPTWLDYLSQSYLYGPRMTKHNASVGFTICAQGSKSSDTPCKWEKVLNCCYNHWD